MVDALTNARDAERAMHQAQQAAKAAQTSHDMTKRSVLEIGKLVSRSGSVIEISSSLGGTRRRP